jgi:hypothetical protein
MTKGAPERQNWTLNSNTTLAASMDSKWLRKRENVSSIEFGTMDV